MLKKIFVFLIVIITVFSLGSCGIKNEKNKQTDTSYSFTQKPTAVKNYFKEKLPEFNFSEEPVERYRDGISYTLSVTCSQKEFNKYVNKLKDIGFELNSVEADTYFSANTEDKFFVEVTYIGDMLTVFVKMI